MKFCRVEVDTNQAIKNQGKPRKTKEKSGYIAKKLQYYCKKIAIRTTKNDPIRGMKDPIRGMKDPIRGMKIQTNQTKPNKHENAN